MKNGLKWRNINSFGIWFDYKEDRVCWCWPWNRYGRAPGSTYERLLNSEPNKEFKWLSIQCGEHFRTLDERDEYWSIHGEEIEKYSKFFEEKMAEILKKETEGNET